MFAVPTWYLYPRPHAVDAVARVTQLGSSDFEVLANLETTNVKSLEEAQALAVALAGIS